MKLIYAKLWLKKFIEHNLNDKTSFSARLNCSIVNLSHRVCKSHGKRGHSIRQKVRINLQNFVRLELRKYDKDWAIISPNYGCLGSVRSLWNRSRFWKAILIILKAIAFSMFTIVTALPSIIIVYLFLIPEMDMFVGLGLFFASGTIFFQYVVPNFIYFVVWIFIVYKMIKRRCKWWYHIVLVGVSVCNWYAVLRIVRILSVVGKLLGGF